MIDGDEGETMLEIVRFGIAALLEHALDQPLGRAHCVTRIADEAHLGVTPLLEVPLPCCARKRTDRKLVVLALCVAQAALGHSRSGSGDCAVVLLPESASKVGSAMPNPHQCDREHDDQPDGHGEHDPFPGLHDSSSRSCRLLFPPRGVGKPRLLERRGGHPLTRSHFHEARKESVVDTDRVEGKVKETEGETQQKWGEAKDKARDTWEDVKDKVEDVVDRGEDKVDDLNEPDRTEESTDTR